jgi:nucleotide-binding universal stress UspA family protein
MFRNILVTIDCSPQSESALNQAIDLAQSSGARLTILASIPHPPSWACNPVSAAALPALSEELQRDAQKNLRCAVDRVPGSVPVTTILSPDPIRKALSRELERSCHDLLVVGSRGNGPLSSGIARHALKHSPIPVLIVHAGQSEAAASDAPAKSAVPAGDRRSGPLPATG